MRSYVNKLTPEQVSDYWDIIKYAIERSLPPITFDHPDKINRILSSALSGVLEVWAYYTKFEDRSPIFEGIGVTKIVYDEVIGTKDLLIYCLYGYIHADESKWIDRFSTIIRYAKANNCRRVTAYSDNQYVIDMMKGFGAEASYIYLSVDVEKFVKKLNELSEV